MVMMVDCIMLDNGEEWLVPSNSNEMTERITVNNGFIVYQPAVLP